MRNCVDKLAWHSYSAAVYLVNLAVSCLFLHCGSCGSANAWTSVYLYSGLISFAAMALSPLAVPWLLDMIPAMQRKKWWRCMVVILSGLFAGIMHLIIIFDYILLTKFGYHINGLVINLFLTPGGFESMGLDMVTLLVGILGIVCVLAFNQAIAWYVLNGSVRRFFFYLQKRRAGWYIFPLSVLCLIVSLLLTGIADFKVNVPVLMAMETFPAYPKIRMRTILRFLKVEEPEREKAISLGDSISRNMYLSYPQKAIERKEKYPRYNVIWLVGESLRADLMLERIMPNTWNLGLRGWRFANHFSGGHGTRPGMFTMFYGLYGNYWDNFLNCSRQPLLFDWMQDDGYNFRCQTSAKFSYPEFDRTIFASMAEEQLYEFRKGEAWKRDEEMTDAAIDFIQHQTTEKPFFLFCFYESTHAPYSFPEDQALETDYLKNFNYVTVSSNDAGRLYNRDINGANHIDRQIGRLLENLMARPEIYDSTIIIITGDHGEEFYEKGHLGHNSTFVREQINVPFILVAPGLSPNVYTEISHHTDIVPTLAGFFGVTNPPEDYSVGGNLLSDDYHRESFVSVGWDMAALVTKTHKLMLPIGGRHFFCNQEITTFEDVECPEYKDEFYRYYAAELAKAQYDMHRFVRKNNR